MRGKRRALPALVIAMWMASQAFSPMAERAVAGGAPQQCFVLDDCSGVSALPSADDCEADDCACAQQIECYVRGQEPAILWPVLPGGSLEINRNFFHNRFVETRISPDALEDWVAFRDAPGRPASFAHGTIVYKQGFFPSDEDVGAPAVPAQSDYLMVKIAGYCPDGSSVGNSCLGGDWFALELNNADIGILEAGLVAESAKSTRCFACHAAAESADWLWQLHSFRRFP